MAADPADGHCLALGRHRRRMEARRVHGRGDDRDPRCPAAGVARQVGVAGDDLDRVGDDPPDLAWALQPGHGAVSRTVVGQVDRVVEVEHQTGAAVGQRLLQERRAVGKRLAVHHHHVRLPQPRELAQAAGAGSEEAKHFLAVAARLVDYAVERRRHEAVDARAPALGFQVGQVLLDAQAVRRYLGGVGHDEGDVHPRPVPVRCCPVGYTSLVGRAMCGIAGLLRLDGEPADPAAPRTLVRTMIHRGPDGEGYHVDGPFGFGMRRLSIIDLTTGDQPIANEDGQVWVVFNGEIYNYRELRADLERRGHRFATHTDTEVLVHLYEEDGPGLLRHLRGMFAFALWDARARRLLLARDRAGKKPLYYAHLGDRLLFGSELKALLADPTVPRDLDHTALYQYLCLGFVPHPRTVYRAIRTLSPGHFMLADARGGVREERYWQLRFAPKHAGRLRAIDAEIEALLRESVRLRLRSDVPLGVFLSGG